MACVCCIALLAAVQVSPDSKPEVNATLHWCNNCEVMSPGLTTATGWQGFLMLLKLLIALEHGTASFCQFC